MKTKNLVELPESPKLKTDNIVEPPESPKLKTRDLAESGGHRRRLLVESPKVNLVEFMRAKNRKLAEEEEFHIEDAFTQTQRNIFQGPKETPRPNQVKSKLLPDFIQILLDLVTKSTNSLLG